MVRFSSHISFWFLLCMLIYYEFVAQRIYYFRECINLTLFYKTCIYYDFDIKNNIFIKSRTFFHFRNIKLINFWKSWLHYVNLLFQTTINAFSRTVYTMHVLRRQFNFFSAGKWINFYHAMITLTEVSIQNNVLHLVSWCRRFFILYMSVWIIVNM